MSDCSKSPESKGSGLYQWLDYHQFALSGVLFCGLMVKPGTSFLEADSADSGARDRCAAGFRDSQ